MRLSTSSRSMLTDFASGALRAAVASTHAPGFSPGFRPGKLAFGSQVGLSRLSFASAASLYPSAATCGRGSALRDPGDGGPLTAPRRWLNGTMPRGAPSSAAASRGSAEGEGDATDADGDGDGVCVALPGVGATPLGALDDPPPTTVAFPSFPVPAISPDYVRWP